MSNAETYKRGQVEWALWGFFLQGRQTRSAPPKTFLTRIKRLLEIDRREDVGLKSKTANAPFAFVDEVPEGKGADIGYRPFNAFCLALGLDLLDMGFKQSEIVFLLRNIRRDLERRYEAILRSPPSGRQRLRPKDRPDAPTFTSDQGNKLADCRVFVVISKVEIRELFPQLDTKLPKSTPIIMEPRYCHGIEELHEELHPMGADNRKAMVVEIANTAVEINQYLAKAPLTRRGRQ